MDRHARRRLITLSCTLIGATALAACGGGQGGSSDSPAGGDFAAPTAAPDSAKRGGDLTVIAASDVDYIDPSATYYQFGYMVTGVTQSPLVGYAPADIDAQPLLAASEPTVSADGKTITYKLRDDVRFSPPVNRVATAADVKYAIERALLPGVAN